MLLALPLLIFLTETWIYRKSMLALREERADKRKILSNSINGILHRISQPIFALKMAWEQIDDIRKMRRELTGEEYDQYLRKLSLIFGDSIVRLNTEILDCRKKMATSVIKPRTLDMDEVMEVMMDVREECEALGVKLIYQTNKKESESGKSNYSALRATTYGDLKQLQEIVYNTAVYCAKYSLINKTKLVQVTVGLRQEAVWLKIGCPQPFISKAEFEKLTAGSPVLESEYGLGNAIRIAKNFGGSVEFSNGFLLVFPRK